MGCSDRTLSCVRGKVLEETCPGSESYLPCSGCGEKGSLIPDPSAHPPNIFMAPAVEPTFGMECKLHVQNPSGIEQNGKRFRLGSWLSQGSLLLLFKLLILGKRVAERGVLQGIGLKRCI